MEFSAFLVKMGQNIRAARAKAGLRQIDVHSRIGLTYRHYQDIEAGRVNVTVETLFRLATLYQLDICELVKGSGPPSSIQPSEAGLHN